MASTNRCNDIKHRLQMAMSEKSMYLPGTRHYNELQEVVNAILHECTHPNKHIKLNRYSFRLDANGYRLVALDDHEKD